MKKSNTVGGIESEYYQEKVFKQRLNNASATKANSPRNTRDQLVRTAGNEDPMHGVCIPHKIPRALKHKGWSKRKKQTDNSQRVVKIRKKVTWHEEDKSQPTLS